jgi:LysR family transcriptional regulator, glycine cleavage system transcriptional activator
MFRLPPLTELRAFEAAARLGSFRRAASELHVTPTAISHQIRLFEQAMGMPLFRRRPRPLTLTDAGARLFPGISGGLALFAEAVESVRASASEMPLVVTTTNAFAARWLIPRLPGWRTLHPDMPLELIGTDSILDLHAGEAHLAVRYARSPPAGCVACKLFEDRHWPSGVPGLLPIKCIKKAMDLRGQTLIHAQWLPGDNAAPTWRRWFAEARAAGQRVPEWNAMRHLRFREEAHAIDAALAGQGIAMCSDVLVARELADGLLVRLSRLSLPGYVFFLSARQIRPSTEESSRSETGSDAPRCAMPPARLRPKAACRLSPPQHIKLLFSICLISTNPA